MFQIKFSAAAACFFLTFIFFNSARLAAQPAWVNNPHSNHSAHAYIAAVGHGNSRQAAERDALRGIAVVFGINVQSVESVTMLYREVVTDGGMAWAQSTEASSEIQSSVRMENLMGASVAERWDDNRGNHFVLAVLGRARAVILYSERIQANQEIIRNLTNMPAAQRNNMDGFTRYQTAAAFADMNSIYGEILVLLGAPWHQTLVSGEDFRQRAREIARSIPIGINVRGVDNMAAGRIQDAFAEVLFDEFGFMTGRANPPLALNVDITTRQFERGGGLPSTTITLSWIQLLMYVRANLVDTGTGLLLLPFDFSIGRQIQSEGQRFFAENAIIDEAVRYIRSEYGDRLARLVPRR